MILVTGAGGIMGSALVMELSRRRLDYQATSKAEVDLSKCQSLEEIVTARPDIIVHLAAAVPHSTHWPDVMESGEVTRRMDALVVHAAHSWNSRLIYASTCSLYNKMDPAMKDEDAPLSPKADSPYMLAKYEGENAVKMLGGSSILRMPAPLSVNLPSTVVASQFVTQALAGRDLIVKGTGKREQNYVDVYDIARCILSLIHSNASGVFNVSADRPTTMKELARVVVDEVGFGCIRSSGSPDPLEGEHAHYSNERAREILEWSPEVSLRQSIRHMIRAAYGAN